MRPGQSCPGVGLPAPRSGSSSTGCFNEAGAIMPRSGSILAGEPSRVAGFNEAGAIMPRSGLPGRRT